MDKVDAAFIIIALIILIIWAIYLLIAYRRRWPPFQSFVREAPSDGFLVNANRTPLTQEQIDLRQKNAAIMCENAANTINFMADYCGVNTVDSGGIDCSMIVANNNNNV